MERFILAMAIILGIGCFIIAGSIENEVNLERDGYRKQSVVTEVHYIVNGNDYIVEVSEDTMFIKFNPDGSISAR